MRSEVAQRILITSLSDAELADAIQLAAKLTHRELLNSLVREAIRRVQQNPEQYPPLELEESKI